VNDLLKHPLYPVVQPFIINVKRTHYDETDEHRIALILQCGGVAEGRDSDQFNAEAMAIEVAHKYALKQGWIINPQNPEQFSFSDALNLLKQGNKICRKGWNGADQWLSISCRETKDMAAESFWSPHNAEFARQNGGSAKVAPCITLKNAQGMIIMGWIPSAGDLFANDWMISQ
jgi:hypothetical protein